MSLKSYTEEQLTKKSMIEVAGIVLNAEKTELNFLDLFNKVAELKQFTSSQKENLLAQFYSDLNTDGRYSTIGGNRWGLKRWYPADHSNEQALAEARNDEADEEDLEGVAELGEDELDNEDEKESTENDDFVDAIDLLEDDLIDDDEEEMDDMGFGDDTDLSDEEDEEDI